jgi:hypothetical protein
LTERGREREKERENKTKTKRVKLNSFRRERSKRIRLSWISLQEKEKRLLVADCILNTVGNSKKIRKDENQISQKSKVKPLGCFDRLTDKKQTSSKRENYKFQNNNKFGQFFIK